MAQNANDSNDFEVVDFTDDEVGPADALDLEAPAEPDTTKGRAWKVRHEGVEFIIPDFIKGRRWRDVEYTLASLNGEMGVAATGDAVMQVLGSEQGAKTAEWDFYQYMGLGEKLGKIVQTMLGQTGKSRR
jgi:hypothetical protein